MKSWIWLCAFFYVTYVASAAAVPPEIITKVPHLLGSKECTWGPTYWCSNITNAKSCNAVRHCIQTVWEHKQYPEDNDNVCQICLKMVGEARAQLESNETQEELREVFEGSCKLIPLNIVADECCKLVDDFIPELVETLASQMNPQQVCSVAGLCNNARIDAMLEQQKSQVNKMLLQKQSECDGCHTVVKTVRKKFDRLSRDQILQGILGICGRMGSLADGCTEIILTYFNEIYRHLENHLNSEEVCLMAGVCTAQFHKHVEIEVIPLAELGKVDVSGQKDELPCELCEQLVTHLRDLLIANTTEEEFQKVLQGLCAQTKSFKSQCLSLVNEYYPQIYHFLMSELDPQMMCNMIGICHNGKLTDAFPTNPLLPVESVQKAVQILGSKSELISHNDTVKIGRVKIEKGGSNVRVIRPESVQLPIERLMPPSLSLAGNTQLCTFCEYFLHFLQQEITSPKTEEKIKKAVDSMCEKLPKSVSSECVDFVESYGDAFVALLAQEIDPSQVCPLLSLCPAAGLQEVEVLIHSKPNDKPNCPLCLFAVTQLEEMLKDHKTEDSIKNALDKLCSHLPKNLAPECQDFVHTYSKELIEMLIADLNPQEVCVYLKLCDDKRPVNSKPLSYIESNGEFTNEILDNTVEGKLVAHPTLLSAVKLSNVRSPQCVVCKFIMSQLEKELKNNKTQDEIKRLVHDVCNHLPKSVSKDCNDFITGYADVVIQLLIQTMEPEIICSFLAVCEAKTLQIAEEVLECAVCETTVTALAKLLNNPKVDHKMEHVLKKACLAVPQHTQEKCKTMIDTYGDTFFQFVSKLSDGQAVCHKVGLCSTFVPRPARDVSVVLVGVNDCSWGPDYWCARKENAKKCGAEAISHCQEKVWGKNRSTRQVLVGSNKCTWGPSYWCANMQNAQECSAVNHCQEKVWGKKRSTRQVLIGSNRCTWGPGYWCASMQNAEECSAVQHCQDNVWSTSRVTRQIAVGGNRCTWGPSYWCASRANAKECQAESHCEQNVWKKSRSSRSSMKNYDQK